VHISSIFASPHLYLTIVAKVEAVRLEVVCDKRDGREKELELGLNCTCYFSVP